MAAISLLKLARVIVAICMVLGATSRAIEAALSCSGVSDTLSPCMPYLKGSGPTQATPSESCCAGVRSLKATAEQTGEHRALCECMKSTAASIKGLNNDLAAKLPAQCGVTMSYTFSPNTDCTKVTG
ncbi:non-specific lipid-transfer protein-like [Chenopodium quinoa]|uniref:Non-specific lipid-transfer protein n=1 Tax=Chenopodium quinoa TaxID=63459 RepID=A0A803MHX8_CHEQI|nr:non-specific lipid-transfer protein-like [Chenopodium quinoa]